MKLALLSVGLVTAAVINKPNPGPGSGKPTPPPAPQAAPNAPIGSQQIADSKSSKIADFLSSMQNRVGRAENRAALAKTNGTSKNKSAGNKFSRRQKKAAKKSAKTDARKDIVARDPEAEEVFSGSASISFEASRRCTDHFSFSESEHYRDCSTTSSSSSGRSKKSGCKKDKKKKVGYRLRHVRVHAEESRARKNEFSASASASIDLGEADASGSLSASAEFKRQRTTVLRCCEDELSRRRKHCRRRSYNGGSYDPYCRVDYRKKIYYNDDAERRYSVSLSGSLSIEEEPVVTTTTEVAGKSKPTKAP